MEVELIGAASARDKVVTHSDEMEMELGWDVVSLFQC